MDNPGYSPQTSRRHWTLIVLALSLLCLMMRALRLMALPIFGDEAIYLRWAQLIRGEGIEHPALKAAHLWVSLADPKPPLHFWMIASVFHGSADPLLAARWISVIAGVLSVPLIFLICEECAALFHRPRKGGAGGGDARALEAVVPTGPTLGLVAAILVIYCPFLAFYQRLATADALFTSESMAIVWLSLRWARLATGTGKRGSAWLAALGLGSAIGLGLMTRQGISYTLCAMPAVAWLLSFWAARYPAPDSTVAVESPPKRPGWRMLRGGILQLLVAAVVAAAIWSPYLCAELHQQVLNRRPYVSTTQPVVQWDEIFKELKLRIFYKEEFSNASEKSAISARNLELTFVPGRNQDGEPDTGWFYYYLTPGIFSAAMVGMVYLLARRHWRLWLLLVVWLLLTIGPPILLGNVIFSRYLLAGVPPLLIAAAYLIAELLGMFFVWFVRRITWAWICAGGLMIVLLALPMRELGLQASQWPRQTLTVKSKRWPGSPQGDRYQYVSGWTAGRATRDAVIALLELSKTTPLVVITGNGWGTPDDAVWVYLSQAPNVTLYYTDNAQVLTPGTAPGTVILRQDKWLWPAPESVTLPPGVPVLFVCQDYIQGSPAEDFLKKHNPNLGSRQSFKGIDGPEGGVSIFRLDAGAATTRAGVTVPSAGPASRPH